MLQTGSDEEDGIQEFGATRPSRSVGDQTTPPQQPSSAPMMSPSAGIRTSSSIGPSFHGVHPLSVLAGAAEASYRPPYGRGHAPVAYGSYPYASTSSSVGRASAPPSRQHTAVETVYTSSREPSPSYHTCNEDSTEEEDPPRRRRPESGRRVRFQGERDGESDFPAEGRESAHSPARLRQSSSSTGAGSRTDLNNTSSAGMSRPLVKLETYNGTTSLETFLAKFENASAYLRWNEADRLFHLRASLQGTAGQLLWVGYWCHRNM